jgi:hypothetical protein
MLCEHWGCDNSTCLPKLKSAHSYPTLCAHDDDCASEPVDGVVYYTECTCGFNSDSNSYCGLFPGDGPAEDYIEALQSYIGEAAINTCNTERRFEMECLKYNYRMHYYNILTYFKTRYYDYPLIQNNDDCVRAVYTLDYKWAQANYDQDDSAVTNWVAGVLLAASLVY